MHCSESLQRENTQVYDVGHRIRTGISYSDKRAKCDRVRVDTHFIDVGMFSQSEIPEPAADLVATLSN